MNKLLPHVHEFVGIWICRFAFLSEGLFSIFCDWARYYSYLA